jgi:hypothetical protein
MPGPCFKCEDRSVDIEAGTRCHATCKRYADFLQQVRQNNQLKDKLSKTKRMPLSACNRGGQR